MGWTKASELPAAKCYSDYREFSMTVSLPAGSLLTPVYFDYAATTPVDAAVAEQMINCLTRDGIFANPASRSHLYGWQAEEAVEQARLQVADLINADSREIIWTSGATEAANLALKGVVEARRRSEEHTSELQSRGQHVCGLLLEEKEKE